MKKIENSYKKSGVNISLANKLVQHISKISKKKVKKKNSSSKKEVIGGFGSLFDISNLKIKDPVIVSCTDGVGTKIDLTNKFKKFDTIGIDLVAMCVNDLVVSGATPLTFLDYYGVSKLNRNKGKEIIKGILKGCDQAGCELIGGETAEMPNHYTKDNFDLVGFAMGINERKNIIDGSKIRKNNAILALPSSGFHSNGYSLINKIINSKKTDRKLQKKLLTPTKIYVKEVLELTKKLKINGMAHITGGGLEENLSRINSSYTMIIDRDKCKLKGIFLEIMKLGNITRNEMYKVFNCGIGFCLILDRDDVEKAKKINSKLFEIGYVSKTEKKFIFKN